MSSATIDRMLSSTKKSYQLKQKGKSTTKPGTLLKSTIPVRTFADWNEDRPGFMETDLVAFCGQSVKGDYVNGLDITDVATGWVLLEVVMGKGQTRIHQAIDSARNRLLFPLLGLDSDNGTEFINGIMCRYCAEHKITFTRIRPYRKNDNCFVEQKNYTVLRRFLGYSRYDTDQQLTVIRKVLRLVELYVNFFQPSMKLIEKHRDGAKTIKKYDKAKTPYQRLLEYNILTKENKKKLRTIYLQTNPLHLKRKIDKLLKKLFHLLTPIKMTIKLQPPIVTNLSDLTNRSSVT